ncbi:DUF1631 family protein [Chitinibacteraceae bacterium HSL-7]
MNTVMDQVALLNEGKEVFVRSFQDAADAHLRALPDLLLKLAEKSGSMAESRRVWDARGLLDRHHVALRLKLNEEMVRLVERSLATAYRDERPRYDRGAAASMTLSLVNEAAFEDELRLDAMAKYLRSEAEEQLRDLNIRVALLYGQDIVKERENPYRPYLISRCVANAVDELSAEHAVGVLLVDQLCEGIALRMPAIYEALNGLFARHGIAAELQLKVKSAPVRSAMPPAASATPEQGGHIAAPAVAAQAAQQAVNQLMAMVQQGLTAGQGMPPVHHGSGVQPAARWLGSAQRIGGYLRDVFGGQIAVQGGASPALQGELGRLSGAYATSDALVVNADGTPRNLLLMHRAELFEQAGSEQEEMTIDVVAMLFEFILRDPDVPAEVRAQLGRLQFAVLKLALADPALLSERNHPVRVFVNRIGSLAVSLKRLDPDGSRLSAEVCRIVEDLLRADAHDAETFSLHLDSLDQFIAQALRQSDKQMDKALEAVSRAEARSLTFARLSAMMSDALEGFRLDRELSDFLLSSWVRVIEVAMRRDEDAAQHYWMTSPELVWSVAPKVSDAERLTLRALLLPMISSLRTGLHAARRQEDVQPLMSWLLEAHKLALRTGSAGDLRAPSLAFFRERFAAQLRDGHLMLPELAAAVTVPDRELLSEAIREMETQLDVLDQSLLDDAGIAEVPEGMVDEYAQLQARLMAGVGVEVNLDGRPTEAVLRCTDLARGKMVLSLGYDRPPSVLSLKVFRRLLAMGRARFLEETELFERAIGQLLDSADRLDRVG